MHKIKHNSMQRQVVSCTGAVKSAGPSLVVLLQGDVSGHIVVASIASQQCLTTGQYLLDSSIAEDMPAGSDGHKWVTCAVQVCDWAYKPLCCFSICGCRTLSCWPGRDLRQVHWEDVSEHQKQWVCHIAQQTDMSRLQCLEYGAVQAQWRSGDNQEALTKG